MNARVIRVAFGDDATPLPAEQCGCSPLDGCCLPPRPELVTLTEEQQDEPVVADTVAADTSKVEFPQFRLKNNEEMLWFKAFMCDRREHNPNEDLYVAISSAVRSVEAVRETIACLREARDDILAGIDDQDWDYANEIIEEFFPEDEFPEIAELATADAPRFFEIMAALIAAKPLADTDDLTEEALALLDREDEGLAAAEISADIDLDVKLRGEEAVLATIRRVYATNPFTLDFDFSDFTIDEFKVFNAMVADLEEAGIDPYDVVNEAFDSVINARDEAPEELAVCDCLESQCAVDDEDLTHLRRIIYVYADEEFTIEDPLYRIVLDDGTHCIENDEAGFELPAGFTAVVLYPAALDASAFNHIKF